MRARLFSKLTYVLVGAAALTALVLSLVAILKLQEARSIEVRNARTAVSAKAPAAARAPHSGAVAVAREVVTAV